MRTLLCALVMLASQSQAFESHYIVNQDLNKGQLEMNFHQTQRSFLAHGYYKDNQGSEDLRALELGYSHAIGELTSIGVSTQFIGRSYNSDTNGQSHTVNGLGDIGVALKSGTIFKPLTLTYGANGNLSPGAAKNPYSNPGENVRASGNNFSGVNSIAPFVGIESYFGQIAVGGGLVLAYYGDQYVNSNNDPAASSSRATTTLRTEGFVEFPVFNRVDVGMNVAMGNRSFGFADYYDRGNEYLARIYGQYKIDKDTSFMAAVSSENTIVPVERDSTDLTVGLRRSL